MQLPGRPHIPLPNIIVWTCLGAFLAPMFLTWLCEHHRDNANAETPFPSLFHFWLLPLGLNLGFRFLWPPLGLFINERNLALEGGGAFPFCLTAQRKPHTKIFIYWLAPRTCTMFFMLVDPSSWATSMRQMVGYWAWEEGGSVLLLSCPASMGLTFGAVFLAQLCSISLLAPVLHISSVLAMGT